LSDGGAMLAGAIII